MKLPDHTPDQADRAWKKVTERYPEDYVPKPEHDPHPERPAFRASYGRQGTRPDFDRCGCGVWSQDGWATHQCRNKARYDPDAHGPTRCNLHSLATAREKEFKYQLGNIIRNDNRDKVAKAADMKSEAVALIRKIAAGHNDPRGAALEFISKHNLNGVDEP